MASVIDICNLALSRFGQNTINDLEEASEEARQCNLLYESVRDSVLREYPWNFAVSSIVLAQTTLKVIGWPYTYQYPANCLLLRRVYSAEDARKATETEYQVETDGTNKYICSDVYQAYADITIKITDPTLFDSQFVEALSYKLASQLVIPLSGSAQRKQELYQEYKMLLPSAQLSNAVENKTNPQYQRSYIKARR